MKRRLFALLVCILMVGVIALPASAESAASKVESFVNVNVGTNAGMEYPEVKAFSVQFAPETAWVPLTPNALYEKLKNLMEKEN